MSIESSRSVSITPLRKNSLKGVLYVRNSKIEAAINDLLLLSRDEIVARCEIREGEDSRYIPCECVLYLIRVERAQNSQYLERLYKILAERILRRLPKRDGFSDQALSLAGSTISDEVFGRFFELLSKDRSAYVEKLDYFEVRFDAALASMRIDAAERAWRHEGRSVPLEIDQETGDLSTEVERAAGSFDPFSLSEIDDTGYRLQLDAAIDTLTALQKRIMEMFRQGIPIHSIDPTTMTIAKTLGRSEKTIRTHRDKAFAALREALKGDRP